MEADEHFLASLAKFPESHRFALGSDGLQIWGGHRAEDEDVGEWQSRKKNNKSGGAAKDARSGGGRHIPGMWYGARSGSNRSNNNNDIGRGRNPRSAQDRLYPKYRDNAAPPPRRDGMSRGGPRGGARSPAPSRGAEKEKEKKKDGGGAPDKAATAAGAK